MTTCPPPPHHHQMARLIPKAIVRGRRVTDRYVDRLPVRSEDQVHITLYFFYLSKVLHC